MDSKRGVFIAIAIVLVFLFGTLWVYDSFVSPESKNVKLGNEDKLLQSYVKETLLPEYVPKQLAVEHRLIGNGEKSGTDYTYGALWDVDGVKAYAFLHYTRDLTALSDMGILIELNQASSLNDDSAKFLLSKYFKQVKDVSCGSIVCEGFTGGDSVEQGVGIAAPDENRTLLFSCKHFKDGEMFGTTGSCIGG